MFKKLTAIAILVISIPVMAYASPWMLNTWARSTGGSISVGGTSQVVTDGSVFNNYTGGEVPTVRITANAGFTAYYFTNVEGTLYGQTATGSVTPAQSPATISGFNSSEAASSLTSGLATLWVVFRPTAVSVTAAGGTHSSVNMTSVPNIVPGDSALRNIFFTFTAQPGYVINSIGGVSTNGTTAGIVYSGLGTAYAKAEIPTGYPFTTALSFTAVDAGSTTASTPNAGATQHVAAGSATVTLTGSIIGEAVSTPYPNFTLVSYPGPSSALSTRIGFTGANASTTATFTAYTSGTYVFAFNAGVGNSAVTSVIATHSVPSQLSEGRVCQACHNQNSIAGAYPTIPWANTIYAAYSASVHNYNHFTYSCNGCHTGTATGGHPGSVNADTVSATTFQTKVAGVQGGAENTATLAQGVVFCTSCHAGNYLPHNMAQNGTDLTITCVACHTATSPTTAGTGNIHGFQPPQYVLDGATGCVNCHSFAQSNITGNVNDNKGVRKITTEFTKWSHHVTGVTLQDAHCAACHMEGKVSGSAIVVNATYHMDGTNTTHLRNGLTGTAIAWNPETPNFTNLNTFCLSCHNSTGPTANTAIQALMVPAPGKTNSVATNPFADTISNQYDLIQRPAVVDVASQFTATNPSHHAVLNKRYSGRTRTGSTRAVQTSGASTFDGTGGATGFATNSSASLPGARSTLFDAGRFQNDYMTYETTAGASENSLGDDSVLSCADCHTVGQFAARGSVAFDNLSASFWATSNNTKGISRYYKTAIGAHGSNNEYMLRNNAGTDQLHQGTKYTTNVIDYGGTNPAPYLVCFNCHTFTAYGSTGAHGFEGHDGANDDCNGGQNSIFGNVTGVSRLIEFNNASSATKHIGTRGADVFGNILGIQCANCHNSGTSAGNVLGGIHGAKDTTYTDGAGNTSTHFRFFPGLGNAMFAPGTPSTITGGSQAIYWSYSANHDGNNNHNSASKSSSGALTNYINYSGQTYTQLPVRDYGAGTGTASTSYASALLTNEKAGSYHYTTGGTSQDLSWEVKAVQPISGTYTPGNAQWGCYTLVDPRTTSSPSLDYEAKGSNTAAQILATEEGQIAAAKAVAAVKTRETFYVLNWDTTDGGGANDERNAATYGLQEGLVTNRSQVMFDNWGACQDHNGAAGKGTGGTRLIVRPVKY
jgi:hypothetical protein